MTTFEWNQYIISKEAIGKGSYSKVYYGFHKETRVEVALKKIMFSKLDNIIKTKVISEINILQQINHVNIMKLYDYKFDGDYLLLITEYCNNQNIDTFIEKNPSTIDIQDKIKQIVNGVEYLHSLNIFHRDIKPQNILLHDDTIKIADFGFSVIIKDFHQLMSTICGTPLYMSPELLSYKPYTSKSEVWSLGILFYIMFYRKHPFGALYNIDHYRLILENKANTILFSPIDECDLYITIIKEMLSYVPEDRPSVHDIKNRIFVHSPNEDLPKEDVPKDRIHQLEDEIFRLETMLKENDEDDLISLETEVTGRGRTNKGYDQVTINTDYFTPPESSSYPIQKKSYSSSGSGSSLSSIFSKSLENVMYLFHTPTKLQSKSFSK